MIAYKIMIVITIRDPQDNGPNGTQEVMHESYFLTMITSTHQAKLIKENMPRGLEWFIDELKPLGQE